MSKRRQSKSEKEFSVAMIGPGRLGQALGRLLFEAGISIRFVAGRRMEQARRAVRFIGGGKAVGLDAPQLGDAGVILITTSDAAVGPAARNVALCREDWSGRVVLHACGSLPASALDPFKRRGAWTGSLHPYQTVPTPEAGVRNLVGCFWALEGDRQAKALAKRWVKALHGTSFEISPKAKLLYHLSAFLVCPTVVTLMDCSQRLLQEAGVPRKIAKPMLEQFVRATAKNFAELGPQKALTGPAVRGDWKTLERHVVELRRFGPEVVPAYRELVRLMLKLAGVAPAKSSAFKRTSDN